MRKRLFFVLTLFAMCSLAFGQKKFPKITAADTNATTGFTTFYVGDAPEKGNGKPKEVELVENNHTNKNGQGGGGQGGGGQGGKPGGDPNGSVNGVPGGDPNGSPYGVPGGTKKVFPYGVEYDGRYVYESFENMDDASATFSA